MPPKTPRSAATASPTGRPADVTVYKGYRIEPASYGVNTATWSPRVVISVQTDGVWSRLAPVYSSNATRFPTRDEADRCALDVARAWIDRTVAQQGH